MTDTARLQARRIVHHVLMLNSLRRDAVGIAAHAELERRRRAAIASLSQSMADALRAMDDFQDVVQRAADVMGVTDWQVERFRQVIESTAPDDEFPRRRLDRRTVRRYR